MAWFIGQSAIIILFAFALGVTVGWMLWARRIRSLTVEVVAARIRAASMRAYDHGDRPRRSGGGRDSHPDALPQRALRPNPLRPRPLRQRPQSERPERPTSRGWRPLFGTDSPWPARDRDPSRPASFLRIPAPRIETPDLANFGPFDDTEDDTGVDFDDDSFGTDETHDLDGDELGVGPRGLSRYRDLFEPLGETAERPASEPPAETEEPAVPSPPAARRAADEVPTDVVPTDNADDDPSAGDTETDGSPTADNSNTLNGGTTADRSLTADGSDTAGGIADELARIEAVAARAAVDDFTRIYGIGPKCAAALVGAGIRTYEQLAATNGAQIAAALREAGLRLAANLRTWPSQARSLAYGNRPPPSRRTSVEPGPINGREPAVDENGHEHNGRADRYARPDHRPPARPTEHSATTKHSSPATPSHRSVPPDAFDPDDLARIEGIGPRIAAAFVAAGVRTFAQLAATDVAALRQAIAAAGLVPVPSLPTWPAQARLLADGDEDGFAVMSARLIAGRDVRDDLERIEGIGPQICAALRVAGLHTFRALANSDSGRLRTAMERAGLSTAPHLTTWPAQARLLADGDEDGFAELTKRLADGRDDRRR